ncbi:MAG: T9SS type A sorting domain-containing protein [Bacteroidales bacterium]|nr:T9SS type A sorting domain-containing protein [Bacteroidales bacterium]
MLYISLIDNGNTQALSQDVSEALPPEALDLRNDLLALSPYVSDTVLAEAVKNESVLNPFMLKDVLNANTHGIKSNKVQDAIINRTNPLPVNILTVILDGLNSVSAKEVLEAEISEAHSIRKNLINLQIRNWLLDTSGLGMEPMLMFAQDCNDWDVKAVLLFEDSTQMVTGIPNINAYYQVSNMQRAFQNDGKTLFDLSEQEKSVLNSLLANEDGFADMYALNMLRINGDTNYREPLVLYSEEVGNKYPVSDPLYENMPVFQVFPNPAREDITIAFNEELQTQTECELIDASGVIRAKYTIPAHCTEYYIDLRSYTAGNYFLRLYNDIALKTIHKFIIY